MNPPRLALLVLRILAPADVRDAVVGDLVEECRQGREQGKGRSWCWSQVIRSALPLARLRLRRGGSLDGTTFEGRGGAMEAFLQDLKYALRSLGRSWGFTGLVLLTLALGIGANAVIFSAVNGTILHPFPFPEPDRIVGVGTGYPRIGEDLGFWENLSPAEFEDVRDQSHLLEDVVAWDMGFRQIDTDGPPASTFSAFWWGNALRTLEMRAHLGRGFTDEEIREGAHVALLSHRFWQTHFGADSTLVGRTISVAGEPYTLVGILPEGVLIYGTDLWTVMPASTSAFPRNRRQFQILARTAPGATLSQVNAELEGIARRVEADHAAEFQEYRGWRMEAQTWTDVNVSTLKTAAAVLMGVVGFLLVLVCANVANMLLARGTGRRREMAVRMAMGAGRGRLLAQLLTESVVLAGTGGILGIGLAWSGVVGIRRFLDTLGVPVPGRVAVDGTVLLFTAGLAAIAGLVFGVIPALQAAKGGVGGALGAEARGTTATASRQRLIRTFVGAEVAVALIILVAGGLLLRSLISLASVDPGWETDHVLTLRVTLPPQRYSSAEIAAFYPTLIHRLGALPGVRSAATATQFPGRVFSRRQFMVEDREGMEGESLPAAFTTLASGDFFRTVGMQVLAGRLPGPPMDGPDDPPVVAINEAAADAFFSGSDPLGQRIRLGGPQSTGSWVEIVGVVSDTRNRGLDQRPAPELFGSQEQLGGPNQFFFLIRTEGDPMGALPAVRDAVRALDPEQPIYAIQTAAQVYADQTASRRATAALVGAFAFFALTLAAAGIYGVVSYSVAARVREIGVRMALGARASGVRRMVVGQALVPVALGLLAGMLFSFATARALQDMLFGVGSGDIPTRIGVAAVLLLVAFSASWIPATRAGRLDPSITLREE